MVKDHRFTDFFLPDPFPKKNMLKNEEEKTITVCVGYDERDEFRTTLCTN